jgi:3-oxoacyl-(acyl-carrier-protein) synthase
MLNELVSNWEPHTCASAVASSRHSRRVTSDAMRAMMLARFLFTSVGDDATWEQTHPKQVSSCAKRMERCSDGVVLGRAGMSEGDGKAATPSHQCCGIRRLGRLGRQRRLDHVGQLGLVAAVDAAAAAVAAAHELHQAAQYVGAAVGGGGDGGRAPAVVRCHGVRHVHQQQLQHVHLRGRTKETPQ